MKRVFTILLAALLPAAASATEHRQGPLALPAVIRMLGKGQPVAVTVDLSLCSAVPNDAKPSKTRGGLRINAFRLTDDG
ncbi:VirK family protein, partial [Rhizobium sp. rho-1.1]